jgi:hypothetical protein
LSLFRTPNPRSKSNKIKIAAAGVALAAAAAGGVGAWSASAASHPAAGNPGAWSARAASHPAAGNPGAWSARAASHSATGTGVSPTGAASAGGALALWTTAPASQPVVLDAFTAKSSKAVHLTPKQIARRMLHSFHWTKWQFRWLDLLWSRESSWNVYATNPYSGAYGIPQAVPGDKMSSAGPDWESDARTQIRWGLDYIKERYGSPHVAWEHELATGWY